MAKAILAAKDRLDELDQALVELETAEQNAAIVVAVCGCTSIAAFMLSALWIF